MLSSIAKRLITVLPARDVCSSSTIVRFISTDSTSNKSFAISYLINTCGLQKAKAISVSRHFSFESSKNPDLVLAFFRDNGFSNTQISTLIGIFPLLLLCKIDKTLKPKFDFFKSQGITGSDFALIVSRDPKVLGASLEKRIIPGLELIRTIIHSDTKLLVMLKRSVRVLTEDPHKAFLPNIAILRAQGVSACNIATFLVNQPRVFLTLTSFFCEIVEEVNKMEFDPSQYLFLVAVHGLICMSRSTLKTKFDVYRRWGLSKDEVQLMFRKNPGSLMLSVKNIMSTMNYFVNEMGYTPSLIAKQPGVLMYSLERRITPRCSVIQILKKKGLVAGNGYSLSTLLKHSEVVFLKKFVIRFTEEVPELLDIYIKGGLSTYPGKGGEG